MSFPKKGKSFPKSGDPNNSNGDGRVSDGAIDFALEIASALERTLRDRNTRIKTVAGWTGANERTVKNWLSGQYGPCGTHLVVLIQHSDEVLNAVLSMGRRHDLVFAQKLSDVEQRLLELTSTVKELRSRGPA
jgi:hypothetical protein